MLQTDAIVERVWQVSKTLQRIELSVDASLAAIQSGQLLLFASQRQFLRRKWVPVQAQDGTLIIEAPTDEAYQPGQIVDLLGPIGQPMPWIGGAGKHLLLIAYNTLPTPLLMLAQQAIDQAAEVALVLLGSASDYPFDGIPAAVEVITGNEDGQWQDQDSIIRWADQIFVVVESAFWLDQISHLYEAVKNAREHVGVDVMYGIFDLPLPCGTGACGSCAVRCKTSIKLACTQGMALDLTEVQLL